MSPPSGGIKDGRESIVEFREAIKRLSGKVDVVDGLEYRSLVGLMLGACGFTSSMATFLPELMVNMVKLYENGNISEALRIYHTLLEYRSFIKPPLTMIHLAKIGAVKRGIIKTHAVRPPLTNVGEADEAAVKAVEAYVEKLIKHYIYP